MTRELEEKSNKEERACRTETKRQRKKPLHDNLVITFRSERYARRSKKGNVTENKKNNTLLFLEQNEESELKMPFFLSGLFFLFQDGTGKFGSERMAGRLPRR